MGIFCYQHHINAWRNDTSHLSLEERGVYREMLDAFYASGGFLPADHKQICRIIGAQTLSERRAVALISQLFWEEKSGFFTQKRAQFEIEKIKSKSEKASASAKAKYNKYNELASANAERMQSDGTCERSANQEPRTKNQYREAKASLYGEPKLFSDFWKNFPSKRKGSKEKTLTAYRQALTRETPEIINEAVIRYAASDEVARGFAKGAAAWLNDDRWSVDYSPTNQAANGKRAYADSIKDAAERAVRALDEKENIRSESVT